MTSFYNLLARKTPIYIISHERSGTHLALNLLFRNLYIQQKGAILPRKGIVGDWKNHFLLEDLEFTESIISAHGLSLSEWDS